MGDSVDFVEYTFLMTIFSGFQDQSRLNQAW